MIGVPILQMRKLRVREMKELAEIHRSQEMNLGLSPKPKVPLLLIILSLTIPLGQLSRKTLRLFLPPRESSQTSRQKQHEFLAMGRQGDRYRVVFNLSDYGVRLLKLEYGLCHYYAVCPWTSY